MYQEVKILFIGHPELVVDLKLHPSDVLIKVYSGEI